jgi:hypothetical protein
MRTSLVSRIVAAGVICLICLTFGGCGGAGMEGTYHAGGMVLDFKGDKVTMTAMGESQTLDYKVDGDKVTIVNPKEGDLVLTRNSDGSLNSAFGTFTKTAE